MIERIETGIKGLDQVLSGGIPKMSTVLIGGLPGTGKTILTQNILFNVASRGNKTVYLSTATEPQVKVIRYQSVMGYFDMSRFMSSVIYLDLGDIMAGADCEKILSEVNKIVIKHKPAVLVIDSFKALADLFGHPGKLRRFLSGFSVSLSTWSCTTLLAGEYDEGSLAKSVETAVADGIIYLYGTEETRFQKRYLRVLKMRGTSYDPGQNYFEISKSGVTVFPRPRTDFTGRSNHPQRGRERHNTGIRGLDEMAGGGLPAGSSTIISGQSGTGKTLICLHWLAEGAAKGEKTLLVSFEETPGQIEQKMDTFGLNAAAGNFMVWHVSPVELDLDKHLYNLTVMVEEKGISRVVIDSIDAFETSTEDKNKYIDFLSAMVDYFKSKSISLVLVCRSLGISLTKHGVSYLSDNIIVCKYVRQLNNIKKSITVLKMRGSSHRTEIRELIIDQKGVEVNCFGEKVELFWIEGQ